MNTIEFKQHLEDHQERASELLRTTIVSHVCQDLLTRLTVMILPPTISIPEVGLVNYPGLGGSDSERLGYPYSLALLNGEPIGPTMSVPTTWYFTLVRFCSSSVRCAFLELAVGLRRVSIFMFVYIYMYI